MEIRFKCLFCDKLRTHSLGTGLRYDSTVIALALCKVCRSVHLLKIIDKTIIKKRILYDLEL